jgi:hypothetical protein
VGIDSVIFAGEEFVPSSDNLYRKTLVLKVVGTNPFTVRAVDVNGLSTSSQFSLEYDPTLSDVTAPTITRKPPLGDSTAVDSVLIVLEVVDDMSGVKEVTIHAQVADTSGLKTYQKWVSGLHQGPNPIIITAVDGSPNNNTAQDTIKIYYDSTLSDNTPPTITSVWPLPGSKWTSSSMTIQVQATDDLSGVDSVVIDNMPADKSGEYWVRTVLLDVGDNNIDVWIRDNRGNDTILTYIYTYDPPITPVNITGFTSVNTTNVTLAWEKSALPDFDRYEVFYHTSSPVVPSGQLDTTISDVNTTSHTIRGLVENMRYHFQVFVYDDQGAKAGGAEADTVTANAPPGTITIGSITQKTDSSITLTWTHSPSHDFDSYKVFYSNSSTVSENSTPGPVIIDAAVKTAVVGGLEENSMYHFKVYVYDTEMASTASPMAGSVTLNGVPDSVTITGFTNVTPNSISLSWSPNSDPDFDYYQIFYSTAPGVDTSDTPGQIKNSPTNTSGTISGLNSSTQYYVKVFVFDTGGLYAGSNERDTVTAGAPPDTTAPDSVWLYQLDSADVDTNQIRIKWSECSAPDFRRYIICYDTAYDVDLSDAKDSVETSAQDTALTVTGLLENTMYHFMVYVQDSTGNLSGPSNVVMGITRDGPPPAVTIVSATTISSNAIEVRWNRSTAHDFYEYQLYFDTSSTVDTMYAMSRYSWDVADTVDTLDYLESGLTYYFVVYVVDQYDPLRLRSPRSNVVSAKTPGWEFVKDTLISTDQASCVDIAVYDSTNIYVAATVHNMGNDSATVYKYNGINWSLVGQPNFSPGNAFNIKIKVTPNNIPLVAFLDTLYPGDPGRVTVMSFATGSWTTVGPRKFTLPANDFDFGMQGDTMPYIAYSNYFNGSINCMVYNKQMGQWVSVGSPGYGNNVALTFNPMSMPYVAYSDANASTNPFGTTVKRYTGTSTWQPVGQPGFSDGPSNGIRIAFSKGAAHVAAYEQGHLDMVVMRKNEGNMWNFMTLPEPCETAFHPGLVGSNDSLFVSLLRMGSYNNSVFRYRGPEDSIPMEPVGFYMNGFPIWEVQWPALTLSQGTLYIAFCERYGFNRISVMRFRE